jgi:hypothetical protein
LRPRRNAGASHAYTTLESSAILTTKIDKIHHIAVLEPHGPLSESDFTAAARQVDAMIAESGRLNGIVVHAKSFPGWESFAALTAHLKFVHDHHRKLSRVALATASVAAPIAEMFATHFVAAEIRAFSYDDIGKATQWVIDGATAETEK